MSVKELDKNAVRLWEVRNSTHFLFKAMDYQGGLDKLTRDITSEVDEIVAELVALQFVLSKAQGEWTDTFNVLTATALHVHGRGVRPSESLYGVNGEGKHSNIIDRLKEVILDIQDDPRAVQEAFQLLWSLGVHQLNLNEASLSALFAEANFKFIGNYPKRYYSGIDQLTGKPISEEYQQQAFTHFTRALKLIRARVQKILAKQDFAPFDHLILDWRNSEAALTQLQLALEVQPQVENGVAVLGNQIALPSKEFTTHIDHTKKSGILFQATR